MKKVFLSHPLPDESLAELASQCDLHKGVEGAPVTAARIPPMLSQCTGLVCLLNDRIDRALIESLPRLEFVSSISVGVDHIDIAALTERGIAVGHTPGVLVDATADTAMALLLAAARRVAEGDRYIRAGSWRADQPWSPDFFLGKDVSGATLGIVGFGAIGRAVARRAMGFGMRVIAWNRSPCAASAVEIVALEDALRRSDFISVHVALTADTRNLLDAQKISQLKPGAVLINTARGGIVDEEAVVAALDRGDLFAAGFDVFEHEPLPPSSTLLSHPRVVLAPHIGSATAQTRAAMVRRALDNALAAVRGRPMPYCVNPEVYG